MITLKCVSCGEVFNSPSAESEGHPEMQDVCPECGTVGNTEEVDQ